MKEFQQFRQEVTGHGSQVWLGSTEGQNQELAQGAGQGCPCGQLRWERTDKLTLWGRKGNLEEHLLSL